VVLSNHRLARPINWEHVAAQYAVKQPLKQIKSLFVLGLVGLSSPDVSGWFGIW
jgi:hypothetical protein